MLVAVKPIIQLPHKVLVGSVNGKMVHASFEPTAEVPDEWGKPAVAAPKSPYFEVTKDTKIDLAAYKWNEPGKNATMAEITKKATPEQFQAILAFARKTVYVEAKKTPAAPQAPEVLQTEKPKK
jgi:hypothetical protein